jgi:hypothetical protein
MASNSFRCRHPGTAVGGNQSVAQQARDSHWPYATRHGRDCASTRQCVVKGNVAHKTALALACLGLKAVNANINDNSSGFDPTAFDLELKYVRIRVKYLNEKKINVAR